MITVACYCYVTVDIVRQSHFAYFITYIYLAKSNREKNYYTIAKIAKEKIKILK